MIDVIDGEEWLETPWPFHSHMVSTLGRAYDVRHGTLVDVVQWQRNHDPVDSFRLRSHYYGRDRRRDGSAITRQRTTGRFIRIGVLVWRTFVGDVGVGRTVGRIDRELQAFPWRLENLQLVSNRWRGPL